MNFSIVNEKWLGYDAKEAAKALESQQASSQFEHKYQISFAGFGQAKYEVQLNGQPIDIFNDYKNGVTISFVPENLIPGENVFTISATTDAPQEKATIYYEIYGVPKDSNNPQDPRSTKTINWPEAASRKTIFPWKILKLVPRDLPEKSNSTWNNLGFLTGMKDEKPQPLHQYRRSGFESRHRKIINPSCNRGSA